jgi:protein phosphatase PTC7
MVSICSLVSRAGGTEDEQVQAMADRMVDFARQCMRSKRVSPFESKRVPASHLLWSNLN